MYLKVGLTPSISKTSLCYCILPRYFHFPEEEEEKRFQLSSVLTCIEGTGELEPCLVTSCAHHALLTSAFEHMCLCINPNSQCLQDVFRKAWRLEEAGPAGVILNCFKKERNLTYWKEQICHCIYNVGAGVNPEPEQEPGFQCRCCRARLKWPWANRFSPL